MAVHTWVHVIAGIYLTIAFFCSFWLITDILGYPQKMWIMDVVWPVSALYWGPMVVVLYFRTRSRLGRKKSSPFRPQLNQGRVTPRLRASLAAFHCGAGCVLGDILMEVILYFAPARFFFGRFATELLLDFILAFVLGILFQYFTITPMRHLSVRAGLRAALRADAVSIAVFELGLFAWMIWIHGLYHPPLRANQAVFWFFMQIGMLLGWVVSLPANDELLALGWKEPMP